MRNAVVSGIRGRQEWNGDLRVEVLVDLIDELDGDIGTDVAKDEREDSLEALAGDVALVENAGHPVLLGGEVRGGVKLVNLSSRH